MFLQDFLRDIFSTLINSLPVSDAETLLALVRGESRSVTIFRT